MFRHIQVTIFRNQLIKFLIGAALLTGSVAFILSFQLPYFIAWYQGGALWTGTDLKAVAQLENDIHFLNVEALDGFDSGYYRETRVNYIIPISRSYYGLLLMEPNHILLTKSGNPIVNFEDTRQRFVGTLKPVETDILEKIQDDLTSELGYELNEFFLPYYLDMTEAENKFAWVAITTLFILIALGSVWLITVGLEGLLMPSHSNQWQPLKRYLNKDMPNMKHLIESIEADFSNGTHTIGDTQISRRWIYQNNGLNFKLIRIADVIWVTDKVVTNQNKSTYYLVIRDKHNTIMDISVSQLILTSAYAYLQKRTPWALFGTNPEAERIWKKDRAEFIRQVDERRRELRDAAINNQMKHTTNPTEL